MRFKVFGLIGILAMAGVFAAACSGKGDTIVNTPGATTNGISVSGAGQAFGAPDIAIVTLGVQAQAADVASARETAASTAQAVVDSLKKNGVADKDIQTTQFNISPQYDFRPNGGQTIRGYQVTNVLTVKVRKLDTTSKVLDDATAAGGNNTLVQGITFTIDDPSKLRESARASALDDAKAKANQLATNAGVKLGKPMAISETNNFVPSPANALAAPRTGAADTSTPVQTGELQVDITVTVLYAIE
ncbi:MAG TPA: SIMPL domain-containing protein [Dehalococcoidia bacterium]